METPDELQGLLREELQFQCKKALDLAYYHINSIEEIKVHINQDQLTKVMDKLATLKQ